MIHSSIFLDQCKKSGYTLFTGTPCSYLKPFINYVIDEPGLNFVGTTNEGDAVALATGAWLGGKKSVVMFQNSGLGNAVNPMTSLSYIVSVPFMGIVTLRGEVGGPSDEPQHKLMGKITTSLLELMEIPWVYFPTCEEEVASSFEMAEKTIQEKQKPFFFVMRKGSVDKYALKPQEHLEVQDKVTPCIHREMTHNAIPTRTETLRKAQDIFKSHDVLLATTGKAGRELFTLADNPNQLYMVGSMGCALPMGLGISLVRPKGKVCVLDGDGAILMRMGNMALAGQIKPNNLVHIVLDNGTYDSTGGQRTYSEKADLAQIAQGCSYDRIYDVDNIDSYEKALRECYLEEGLAFVRCRIQPGSPKDLGRPTITPQQVAYRLREHMSK